MAVDWGVARGTPLDEWQGFSEEQREAIRQGGG